MAQLFFPVQIGDANLGYPACHDVQHAAGHDIKEMDAITALGPVTHYVTRWILDPFHIVSCFWLCGLVFTSGQP